MDAAFAANLARFKGILQGRGVNLILCGVGMKLHIMKLLRAHGVIPLQDPITAKLTALWGDEELDFVSMRGRLISALFNEGLPEDAEPLVHCLLEEDTELNVHPETLEFAVFFMKAWQKVCRAGVEPQLHNALEYMLMLSTTHGLP